MSELVVSCDNFSGSLTKLLRLLTEHELDIFAVRLERIIDQVSKTIMDCHEPLPVDEAGVYLVLCSTLLRLKSRRLLPVDETEMLAADAALQSTLPSDETADFPREHYRQVVLVLENLASMSALLCPRGATTSEDLPPAGGLLGKVSLLSLTAAFEHALRTRTPHFIEIAPPECSLPWAMDFLRRTIGLQGRVEFVQVLPAVCSRFEIVMIFLGLLELIKLGEVVLYGETTQFYLERKEGGQVA